MDDTLLKTQSCSELYSGIGLVVLQYTDVAHLPVHPRRVW